MQVDGLVMTDMDAYYAENPISRPTLMGHSADKRTWISDCTCSVCSHRRDNNMEKSSAPFESIYAIYPKNDQILKDLQAFLLPNKIWAYAFRTRSWGMFSPSDYIERSNHRQRSSKSKVSQTRYSKRT